MSAVQEFRPTQPVIKPLLPINCEPYNPYEFLGRPVIEISPEDRALQQSQAIAALDQADSILSNSSPKYPGELELDIAATAAQMGLIDHRVVQRLLYPAPIIRRIRREDWQWSQIAEVAAYIGDHTKALEYARKASSGCHSSRFFNIYPFYLVADVVASRGGDAGEFLDEAVKTAEVVEKAEREDGDGRFLDLEATKQISLAMALRRHGREFEPWLANAAKMILEREGPTGWAYAKLARAYAVVGRFDEALVSVDSIVDIERPENTELERRETLGQIAMTMFESGQPDRAIQLAQDASVWSVASLLLMKKAYLLAQDGQNPSDTLDEGVVAALKLDKDKEPLLGCIEDRRVSAYSVAGRILALAGLESEPKFIQARAHADAEANWEAGESYWRIIQDMFTSGYDVTELFDYAMNLEYRRTTVSSVFYPIWKAALDIRRLEYQAPLMDRLAADRLAYQSLEHSQWNSSYKVRFLLRKALELAAPAD